MARLEDRAVPASYTWDGGGTTDNWSEATNWSLDVAPQANEVGGTSVTFPTGEPTLNDIPGILLSRITFATTPGSVLTLQQSVTFLGTATAPHIDDNGGGATIAGPGTITLSKGDLQISGASGTAELVIAAPFAKNTTDVQDLVLNNGNVTLGGANNSTGKTIVQAGQLSLNVPSVDLAISSGGLVIGDSGAANSAIVRLLADNQIGNDLPLVQFLSDGLLDLNGKSETLRDLEFTGGNLNTTGGTLTLLGNVTTLASANTATITGTVALSTNKFTVANGTATRDLVLDIGLNNSGATANFFGAGLVDLAGTSAKPFSNLTTNDTVRILVSGTYSATSTSTLGTGTTLRGGGTFDGRVDAPTGSTLVPVGKLTLGNVFLGGTLDVTLDPVTVNQLFLTTGSAAADLSGSTLDLALTTGFTPTQGQQFVLIDRDPTAPAISTKFSNAATEITVGSVTFSINYDNNRDVVLTAITGAANTNPTISTIPDQNGSVSTAIGPIGFTVGDAETPAASLTVTATSDNTALVPVANIVFGGTGADRNVTITPVAGVSGSATITITVTDGGGLTAAEPFVVTITGGGTNTPPSISDVANQTIGVGATLGPIGFVVSDAETPASALTVSATSSNGTLVPNGNITLGGLGPNRTVSLTPAAGQTGTATITLTVTDEGGLTSTDTFTFTVTANPPVNTNPTISTISAQTLTINTASGPLAFTIGDAETPVANLSVTATSSNTTLVPNGNLLLGGSGATRSVIVTPATGQTGTTTLTLTVTDTNGASASSTFTVTVNGAASGLPADQVLLIGGSANTAQTVTFSAGKGVLGTISTPIGQAGVVRTVTGDVNGDGVGDFIYGTGPGGGALVTIIDGATGKTLVANTDTFPGAGDLTNIGIFVASGDLDGDGKDEIVVTPDEGGGPVVRIFKVNGTTLQQVSIFLGIEDPVFRGGARPAVGDLDGDSKADLLVAAGFGGGPRVALFNGPTAVNVSATPPKFRGDFFVYEPDPATGQELARGTYAAIGDLDGDGKGELIFGSGPGGGPRVQILRFSEVIAQSSGRPTNNPFANFFAFDPNRRGGVRVAAKDTDGDNRLDLVAGTGENEAAEVRIYPGSGFDGTGGSPSVSNPFNPFGGGVLVRGVFVG
jgi:hypothetical protein